MIYLVFFKTVLYFQKRGEQEKYEPNRTTEISENGSYCLNLVFFFCVFYVFQNKTKLGAKHILSVFHVFLIFENKKHKLNNP